MILCMDTKSTPFDRRQAVIDTFLSVVATRGVESASFRTVADEAGVSLGTVQHYFRTREDLLAATYGEVLRRIRSRIKALEQDGDARERLQRVVHELLPLDPVRGDECAIHLAFAAVAPSRPALQELQSRALGELHDGIAQLVLEAGAATDGEGALLLARAVTATADGLALHALSTGGTPTPEVLTSTMGTVLDRLLTTAGSR